MTHKIKDNTVAVSTSVYWLPIDDDTPRNVKVLAIRKNQGIAQITTLMPSNLIWYTHWQSLPRFPKDECE